MSDQQLADYAGTFGTRTFAVGDDSVLLYQRDVGSIFPMVPMGGDLFRFEGYDAMRFQFDRDGDGIVNRVITLFADGTSETHHRAE